MEPYKHMVCNSILLGLSKPCGCMCAYYHFTFSFGLMPASPLQVQSPLLPNQTANTSLPLNTLGLVQRMEPLTNLQVLCVCGIVTKFYIF